MKGILGSLAVVWSYVMLVTPVSGTITTSQGAPSTRFSRWHSWWADGRVHRKVNRAEPTCIASTPAFSTFG
jgi:hypothetical protein